MVTRSSKKIRKQVTQQQPCHYFQGIKKLNKKSSLSLLIVVFSILLTGCGGGEPEKKEAKSEAKILSEKKMQKRLKREQAVEVRRQKIETLKLKREHKKQERQKRRELQILKRNHKRQQIINKRKQKLQERKQRRQKSL